jgi:membrane-associated phospholipid phosphatase
MEQTRAKYRVILLAAIIFPGTAYAKQDPNFYTFASRVVDEFPATFISDANATFTKPNNLAALLLAGGASIIMHNTDADKNLNDNFDRHRAFNDTSDKFFDYAGNPGIHLGGRAVWYLLSQAHNDNQNRENAWSMLSALAITDTVTFGLKAVVNNDRPNGGNFSFPSAHTASSFCAASMLDEYYGPGIGVPAYIGACMVGWRMMDSGDHWASDVLFGGTLGYIVGHSVAAKHKQLEIAGFQVEPMIAWDSHPATGIMLVRRF